MSRATECFLREHRPAFLTIVTCVYLVGSGALAAARPLWFDELFTVHLARLPDPERLWDALQTGVDVTPPLFNWVTRASVALFGTNEFAFRLPALLGFWVMCLCLFTFVQRRASILHAAAAMLLPVCLTAGQYATEARPYGLLLGACGVALVAWQTAAGGGGRWSPVLLGGALVFATSVHYYGALFVIPLAVGESIRWHAERRIDWRVAAAFAAAPIALLLHLPLIRIAMSYTGGAWSSSSLYALLGSYSVLLGPIVAPLAISGIFIRVVVAWKKKELQLPLRVWETAAIGTMLTLPAICYLVARLSNGIFTSRYAVPAILGFAIACTLITAQRSTRNAWLNLASCIVVVAAFTGIELWHSRKLLPRPEQPAITQLTRMLREHDRWVAIHDPHRYLELEYYLPEDIRPRLVYVASAEQARRYMSLDDDDRSLLLLRRYVPLSVVDGQRFLTEQDRFRIIGHERDGWLLPYLARSGAQLSSEPWLNQSGLWTVYRLPEVRAAGEGSASRLRPLPTSE